MKHFELEQVDKRITVISNYNSKCLNVIDRDDHIVMLGNQRLDKDNEKVFNEFLEVKNATGKTPIHIVSANELLFIENNALDADLWHSVSWLQSQYISASFQLVNYTKYVITSGGFKPSWKNWNLAKINMQQAFVNYLNNGKNWHEVYDGRFGYVISDCPIGNSKQTPHSRALYNDYFATVCYIGPRGIETKIVKKDNNG